jgi:protein-tyrosine-phosphatase
MFRILFICVENCNRSQMAEAFAHIFGAGQIEAYSAGCHPAECVHAKAIAAMAELGYDLRSHYSKGLSDLPDIVFDVAVTMGCEGQSLVLNARCYEDWDIPCPKEMSPEQFRSVRDLIGSRVKDLLARVANLNEKTMERFASSSVRDRPRCVPEDPASCGNRSSQSFTGTDRPH